MAEKINILSTKKLLKDQKQLLLDANILVIEENFIATKSIDFDLTNINENLIFTSQNAVESVLDHPNCSALGGKPVFCVGMKTKGFLEENGSEVQVYTDYAADLAEIISLVYANESFTFFSGSMRRDVLPKTLKENQIVFNEIEVYETSLTPHKVKIKPEAILFFSPSAVESYLKLNKIKDEICFCIGETTAEALENNNIKRIVIAEAPSIENVLSDVIEYFTT